MMSLETLLENSLPLPIPRASWQIAREFARQQPNPQKAERVYLNTLAVLVMESYLQLMAIATDLKQSDSWNPVLRMSADVADLMVVGVGRLECLPVKLDPTGELSREIPLCTIPPEVYLERIGYVAIAIDETRQEATLLGFTKTAGKGEICVEDLRSLSELLEHLAILAQPKVHLSQWFVDVFTAGWQELESFLEIEPDIVPMNSQNSSQSPRWWENLANAGQQAWKRLAGDEPETLALDMPTMRRRENALVSEADVSRAKLIDLGVRLGTQKIVLLVALTQQEDERIKILVQVRPNYGDRYLPPNLKLALLQEGDSILQSTESRGQDLCILLKPFKVLPGTDFKVQVTLGEVQIAEDFTV
ncbi:MAG: DUF1822 family protein [Spirulina sp.]